MILGVRFWFRGGWLGRAHPPRPPDPARTAAMRSAGELFSVVRQGIRMTVMPAWGPTHRDDELGAIVALVARFSGFEEGESPRLLTAARDAGLQHAHDHEHDPVHAHGTGTGTRGRTRSP